MVALNFSLHFLYIQLRERSPTSMADLLCMWAQYHKMQWLTIAATWRRQMQQSIIRRTTGLGLKAGTKFGEPYFCCCLPLLLILACLQHSRNLGPAFLYCNSPLGSAAVSVLPILKSSAAVLTLRKRRRASGSTDANSVFSPT